MKPLNAGSGGKCIVGRASLFPLPFRPKIDRTAMWRKASRLVFMLILPAFFSGCIHVPMSSETAIHDPLQTIQPVEQGEVVLVFGENAPASEPSVAVSYFTANCTAPSRMDAISELVKTILKVNPQPGRFAVRHIKDQETEEDPDCETISGDSILCRLKLSKAKVSVDRLRYAIHVKETFEAKIHVPLYLSPFGLASCGNRTVLEATVWDLPTNRRIGSFSASAEGELTVVAYMLHIVVTRDTQRDAMERLAREIAERLTGLKPLQENVD